MAWPRFDLNGLAGDPVSASLPTEPPAVAVPAAAVPLPPSTAGTAVELGRQLTLARNNGAATVLFCPAAGLTGNGTATVIELLEFGLVTHLCLDFPAALADWQRAASGAEVCAAEAAAAREVAELFSSPVMAARHPAVRSMAQALAGELANDAGAGEQLGEQLYQNETVAPGISVLREASRLGAAVTIHPASWQEAWLLLGEEIQQAVDLRCRRDVLLLANTAENLDRGVVACLGAHPAGVSALRFGLTLAETAASRFQRSVGQFHCWLAPDTGHNPADVPASTAAASGDVLYLTGDDQRHLLEGVVGPEMLAGIRQGARETAGWQD